LRQREEKVFAKGKGELVTYWLEVKSDTHGSKSSSSSRSGNANDLLGTIPVEKCNHKLQKPVSDKIERLIDWNTENLSRLLHQIVASRQSNIPDDYSCNDVICMNHPFDEVKEIIALPQDKKMKSISASGMESLPPETSKQLRDYVSRIAHMYNSNHFHNFEHVSC
jgi:hypothetical protein